MDRRSKSLIAAGVLALVSLAAQADGDPARGEKLAYACLGCHGIEHYKNAYPSYSVPKLGGQNAAYIVSALEQYQSVNRMHPTMRGFASSLTAEDRADLAAFFHSQVPPPPGLSPSARRRRRPKPAPPATARMVAARRPTTRTSAASTPTTSPRR